jgi:hypothetical protein
MSLTALYYVRSVGIYQNVYHFKNIEFETIQKGQRDITVKHTEKMGNVNESENKNDNFNLKIIVFI